VQGARREGSIIGRAKKQTRACMERKRWTKQRLIQRTTSLLWAL